jgi:hypothetical protein
MGNIHPMPFGHGRAISNGPPVAQLPPIARTARIASQRSVSDAQTPAKLMKVPTDLAGTDERYLSIALNRGKS